MTNIESRKGTLYRQRYSSESSLIFRHSPRQWHVLRTCVRMASLDRRTLTLYNLALSQRRCGQTFRSPPILRTSSTSSRDVHELILDGNTHPAFMDKLLHATTNITSLSLVVSGKTTYNTFDALVGILPRLAALRMSCSSLQPFSQERVVDCLRFATGLTSLTCVNLLFAD